MCEVRKGIEKTDEVGFIQAGGFVLRSGPMGSGKRRLAK
jgi:hypothetical protein